MKVSTIRRGVRVCDVIVKVLAITAGLYAAGLVAWLFFLIGSGRIDQYLRTTTQYTR